MKLINNDTFGRILKDSWSLGSSSKWTACNPALGQCGVTALVAQDYLGGEILKTKITKPHIAELWHFYNLIDSKVIDFTISQFDEPINYSKQPSNRTEAFADTNIQQYNSLKLAVEQCLKNY